MSIVSYPLFFYGGIWLSKNRHKRSDIIFLKKKGVEGGHKKEGFLKGKKCFLKENLKKNHKINVNNILIFQIFEKIYCVAIKEMFSNEINLAVSLSTCGESHNQVLGEI